MIKIIFPFTNDGEHERFKYIASLLFNILGAIITILAIISGYNYLTNKQVSNLTLLISAVFTVIFLFVNYRYIYSKMKFYSKRLYNTIKYYLISKYYFSDVEFFSITFRSYVSKDDIKLENMNKIEFDTIMNKIIIFNNDVKKSRRNHKTLFNLVGELGDLVCSYSGYVNNILINNEDKITNDRLDKYNSFRISYNNFVNYFLVYSPIMILCKKIEKEFYFHPYNFLKFEIDNINYDKMEWHLKRQTESVKSHMKNIEEIKSNIEKIKQELCILYNLRDNTYMTNGLWSRDDSELHKLIHQLDKVVDYACLIKDKELVEHLKECYGCAKLLFNLDKCDKDYQHFWTETVVPKIKKEINLIEKDREAFELKLSFKRDEIDNMDNMKFF